jgi:hypothetical protein
MRQLMKIVIISQAFPTLSFPLSSLMVPLAQSISTSHIRQAPPCFGAITFMPLVPIARAFQPNPFAMYGENASSSLDG